MVIQTTRSAIRSFRLMSVFETTHFVLIANMSVYTLYAKSITCCLIPSKCELFFPAWKNVLSNCMWYLCLVMIAFTLIYAIKKIVCRVNRCIKFQKDEKIISNENKNNSVKMNEKSELSVYEEIEEFNSDRINNSRECTENHVLDSEMISIETDEENSPYLINAKEFDCQDNGAIVSERQTSLEYKKPNDSTRSASSCSTRPPRTAAATCGRDLGETLAVKNACGETTAAPQQQRQKNVDDDCNGDGDFADGQRECCAEDSWDARPESAAVNCMGGEHDLTVMSVIDDRLVPTSPKELSDLKRRTLDAGGRGRTAGYAAK